MAVGVRCAAVSEYAAELRRAELRRWARRFPDATPIADLVPRRTGTCVGVVHKIRLEPDGGLQITVDDGTGRIAAAWTGRPRIEGLELGGGVWLEGTVLEDERGVRVLRHPNWWPIAEPYVTRTAGPGPGERRRPRARRPR